MLRAMRGAPGRIDCSGDAPLQSGELRWRDESGEQTGAAFFFKNIFKMFFYWNLLDSRGFASEL